MGENIRLPWGVSRVYADTLDLLEDEERRCLELSVMQCSILRQMSFPWARAASRLVEDHGDYQTIVDQPVAYQEALDELEVLLSGAYDGPRGGCPVGEEFVNRGDPAVIDWQIGAGLTADGTWCVLDVSSVVVDDTATRVLLYIYCQDGAAGTVMMLRSRGNSNAVNVVRLRTQVANIYTEAEGQIFFTAGRFVEYNIAAVMNVGAIVVRGWWKPAA